MNVEPIYHSYNRVGESLENSNEKNRLECRTYLSFIQ